MTRADPHSEDLNERDLIGHSDDDDGFGWLPAALLVCVVVVLPISLIAWVLS